MNILLLEDESILKESIEEYLTSKDYSVDSFENSNDAFDAVFDKEYDLLLLDVNIPGEFDGFSLRKELANENKNIPTIFVTSLSSADAMLQGYANGCCDYIKKPFDLVELLLRVQHALKSNCFKTENNFLQLPCHYEYDIINRKLLHKTQQIQLTKTENEILTLFIKYRNKIVSFEMLYEQIWDNDINLKNARVQINNLRRKLPKDMIENIYGTGYRFDCK